MLQNAYLLVKIGADTAENEQHFAEILPIGRRVAGGPASSRSNEALVVVRHLVDDAAQRLRGAEAPLGVRVSKIGKISKIL